MKRILVALIAALAAAVSLSGCFFVERDQDEGYRHGDRYEHHDYYRGYDRGYDRD